MDKLTVTVAEAVEMTSIGRTQIDWWIHNDIKFPSFKIGRKTMIHVDRLNEYLAKKAENREGERVHSARIAAILAKREAR